MRDTPSVTRDGVAVGLHMNAGLVVDLPHLDESGAQSIGLFRTELQFMLALRFPAAVGAGSALPDGAGDGGRAARHLPHARYRRRQSAALYEGAGGGKSGARMAGDPHRARQAGASAHADCARCCAPAPGAILRIMLPMVSSVDEFVAARALLERELAFADRCGRAAPAGAEGRRDGRSALAVVAARRNRRARRFPVGRLQRSPAISLRRRSRKQARVEPVRYFVGRVPSRLEGDRRRRAAP